MKINCVIGIDPGASGGISLWRQGMGIKTNKMPKNLDEINNFLSYMKEIASPIIFLERVSVRMDDISVEEGQINMGKLYRIQKMMQNFEHLKAIITLSNIPFCLVHPLKWQSQLKLRGHWSEAKKDRKNRYKKVAQNLYPEVNVTLWNSDAILLMHFGRVVLLNDLKWVKENLNVKNESSVKIWE